MKLGKLKQVNLREIWKHEALDFTKWLGKAENIDLLSDEIKIELSVIDTEFSVGRFQVDIYAEEANSERKVIIENQLEKTDHDHLGKLITYASGLDAEIIIWIVKEVLEEHQQAIDWLNENTNEKINFFAIKMEAWKIGNSDPAPRFHIIAQPNNWSKSVKETSQKSAHTPLKLMQLRFWEGFKSYIETQSPSLRSRKPYPQHWYDISFGRSDCHIALTINTQKNEFGCEVYISDSKQTFQLFENNKSDINEKIKGLEWMGLPLKKASRIKKIIKGDLANESKWTEYFESLSSTALEFQDTFRQY